MPAAVGTVPVGDRRRRVLRGIACDQETGGRVGAHPPIVEREEAVQLCGRIGHCKLLGKTPMGKMRTISARSK
jgi:hypothetical protein